MDKSEFNSTQEILNCFKSHKTAWDKIATPFLQTRRFIDRKWTEFRKRCQRFKRGYAWSDVWSMYYWFICTTKPMLEHLLKEHEGHPCNIENEEWESILQEMIDCLELMDEENAYKQFSVPDEEDLSEYYKKVYELMERNKNRFFELFSKWFFDLWD